MRRLLAISALALSLILGAGFAFASPSFAQVDTGLAEVGQTVKLSSTDPRIIATNIINVALGLIGIVLVSLIVYAGFLYMTSGGEAEKVDKAKKIIISSIIGLIIVLSAWAIARFVIERLLQATQGGGGGVTSQQGGGGGGGFGGGGGSNVFQVKSITPQGNVAIRNVQVKMLFSRPVDDKTVAAIVVTKNGGTTVGGSFSVANALVTFTPNDACPAPNATLKCFDGDSDFTVQIGSSLRSTQGQAIVCGGFAPACTATFHTGTLIDTQNPTVSVTEPLDGQAVPADSLVTIGGTAQDDSGVGYIEFYDNGGVVDQAAPGASSTPTTFSGSVPWDTAGIPLQSVRQLTARAFDIDAHDAQSAAVSVIVRSPACFNGVKDGDETDIDCGGTPNTPGYCGACSGGTCSSNIQCSSGVCQNGACVIQPTITSVSPNDGQPGTYVTLQGTNFGASGSVVFLGGPGTADDVVAQAPQACTQGNVSAWSSTQAIVAVPASAASGPISLTNGASQLSDATNDARGPQITDFLVNNAAHPGLCALDPNQGYVGSQFKAIGQGFGSSPSTVSFGAATISSFASWTDQEVSANTPVVGSGKYAVRVNAGAQSSNPVSYTIQSKSSAGPPQILSIDPTTGPKGEYVTILGKNFGVNVGTVRFKNKIDGQEALGDTSFPAACAEGFWNEDEVTVKVPSVFLVGNGSITPGDYGVRVVRSDTSESNAVDFVVSTGNAKPGICAISPNVGPIGTAVTLTGERFGSSAETLTFPSGISAVPASWASGEIKSSVPAGAITGPVTVTVQGLKSNGVNYQVKNCNEQAGICGQNQQCCANGTCISKTQICGAVAQSAMFAWQSSTGLIPIAPRVVEECLPNQAQPPIPSPAPWIKRAGGDQACVSATITMRFTTKLDPTSVNSANIRVKKCTSQSTEPCATTENVPIKAGFPLLQPASQSQDAVIVQPNGDFDTNTTYLVEALTGIKGLGAGGANMDETPSCGQGVGYCFRFKTRASNAPCTVGAVSVSPHPFELNDTGAKVNYLASPLSADDKCVVLQCDKYDWDWKHGDNDDDGRAIFQTPLKPGSSPGTVSCQQIGVAQSETGNVPVNMNATAMPDNVKGTAHLFVKFIPPKVEDYAPNCNAACVNALVWARFSVAIDPASIAGNVEIRPCANENCVLSELGAPLNLSGNSFTLTTVPKTSETVARFLQITPVDQNGNLALIPGTYYRVLLKGGTADGIKGLNGVPMTGLNTPDGFVWTFRTKIGADAFCTAESVDVSPIEKYESRVGARQLFKATPFGKPDECSVMGQMLIQTKDASWATSDALVADYYKNGALDTGGKLPARCDALCLAMGSQGQFGKVAVCGNGIVETTDATYCAAFNAKYGGGCSVLPAGAKNAEQCDPGIANNVGLCDATSCLWKPIAQTPQGTCGNAVIDSGESCDFGRLCLGASATSTTPDLSDCTSNADKAACEANGGTCAARQFRGCSPFCRHTGSASGKSTCGNGDIADGEDCDDGNINSNDGCSSDCLHTGSSASVASVCGNAILEPGETCEKINVNDPAFPPGCNTVSCLHTGTALCDNDPNTPNANCCGNGTADIGEDCDDANKDAGDGCGMTCLLEGASAGYPSPSFCSDGILETGEQCEVNLPSSHASFLNPLIPKSASPVAPKGVQNGDGLVDNVQLATIIGDAEPDAKGLMSSTLSAELEGKTGEATYGLQCGFTVESACDAGFGLTDKGCCSPRPEIKKSYPPHGSTDVCRNVRLSVQFNVPMNPATVLGNVQIASSENGVSCPAGTTQVTEDFTPVKHGFFAWIAQGWNRLVAWATGTPAVAAIWCSGSVAGSFAPAAPGDTTSYVFTLTSALKPDTKYRVKFLGDNSNPNNPLSDNDDLAKKQGIKTAKGVVAPYDSSADAGPLTWSFTTGKQVCAVNLIQVTDTSTEHPLLFIKANESHPFVANAVSIHNGIPVNITPVAEYAWTWSPWTTSANDIVQVASPNTGVPSASIVAQNKNGNAFAVAWLKVTSDTVNTPSTLGNTVQGTAPVTVLLCENPWPNRLGPGPIAPFRDKEPTGDGSDSSLNGTIFENGPYFNFSTTYCRDNGAFGTDDDLPKLEINFVPPTSVDASEGILRQYLFTYGNADQALKKDGIGVRVAANPLHLSPQDWYKWRGFGGSPQPIMVDGYRALKDGTTTYVAAANTKNPGESVYSNVYLISHNPDASPVTVGIYDQMVKNLAFNINLTQEVSNVCMQGNDPNVYVNGPFLVDGKVAACSTDFDCLKFSDTAHCGSYKLKLARDTVRLADYQVMSHAIETYRQKNGSYPKMEAGTYLQGMTTSRWPSWDDAFTAALGGKPAKDPVNQYLTCGRCSESQAVCGADADCPTGQKCAAVDVNGATYDPQACWDAVKRRYLCPKIGNSPSRAYQYRSLNDGQRYEIGSEFEIPKPSGQNAKWWVPELTQEIKRCTNAETLGFMCDVDSDCRPCANPKDAAACPEATYPTKAGACKPAGGRFLYTDVCKNIPYGQGGTCGDGAIGKQCVGGPNAGNGCTVNADCPGGSCTGQELCEIGQTKLTDCKTSPNLVNPDGLKLQTCNECKEFVDDVNLSKCDAGLKCGNGRIDKKCNGGTRNDLSCLSDADCPSIPNDPPASCGPTSETCDDGSLNGTYGHCNLTCNGYASYCGDSQLSPGETCDAGPQNGEYCSGNCNNSCSLDCKGKAPYCGDGVTNAPNEQCDGQTVTTVLGICTSGTGLDQPCSTNADCGAGGTCASSGDLASCQGVTKKRCATSLKQCVPANGTIPGPQYNPPDNVTCQEDSDCSGGKKCRSLQDYVVDCTSDAQCSTPGNPGTCSSYPTAHVRACSATGADKCTYPVLPNTNSSWSECKIMNFCGDGVIDAPGETCDDGPKNGDTKACTSSCKKNVCGDGKPFINVEECDNGSQNGKVTCNADYDSTCASCSSQCKFLTSSGGYCGDQTKNGGEQCDGMEPVTGITDQLNPCPYTGSLAYLCGYLNADCMQQPCQKTKEFGVTCQQLGYDFSTNGVRPKLIALDSSLNVPIDSPCDALDGIKEYERIAYQECLGLSCKKGGQNQNAWILVKKTPPSENAFWACVHDKGPALGVGIQTSNQASQQIVQCGLSCTFSGCGKCSDETGTGIIAGQLVDAVYNQVVPFAKVSLFYKGVLVTQTSSDEDGRFQIQSINDRTECSQYKLVIDKYDDNPCTGNENRPNCDINGFPSWNYPYTVKEDERGGYWPLTTPTFTVTNFLQLVGSQGTDHILLFPRPGVGEAYLAVQWDVPWTSSGGVIQGINTNHVVIPEAYAYTAANSADTQATNYPDSYTPTTCNYADRPAGTHQCARDVTFRSVFKGYADLTKLPYAQQICLHQAGEKSGGFLDQTLNGCPVEGAAKCLAAGGTIQQCQKGVIFPSCKAGPNAGNACQTDADCPQSTCDPIPCQNEWWDSCEFYNNGPLTTYIRYSSFTGASEPIRLYWAYMAKKIFSHTINANSTNLNVQLANKGYHAIISTDTQFLKVNGSAAQNCNTPQNCKFWDIGEIDPTSGQIKINNKLLADRPAGIAMYQTDFQGLKPNGQYCTAGSTLYRACDLANGNADCTTVTPSNSVCTQFSQNDPTQYENWSKANF